jgi:hypothetical protein
VVALAGHAPNWTVPAVTVLYSLTRPFSQGSFFSALADIAGTELLDQASTIEATNLNLSIIVGPAMAGALAGVIGAAGFTGFLEGPAYSGTIALRQRHAPPTARAQVMTTVTSLSQLMLSAGAALGGAIHDPLTLIVMFVAVNLVAAAGAFSRGSLA